MDKLFNTDFKNAILEDSIKNISEDADITEDTVFLGAIRKAENVDHSCLEDDEKVNNY